MINSITLVGRLTNNPENRTTESGTVVTNFTVALNDGKEKTYFFRCVAFKDLASRVTQFLTKGSLVGVNGKLTQRTYKDLEGKTKEVVEIVCQSVEFLSPKKESETTEPVKTSITPEEIYNSDVDSGEQDLDLPF